MKHLLLFFFLLSVLSATVSSCKKGCTNETAINYNSSAKADDASCLFCDSVLIDNSEQTNLWRDYTSGPNFGDTMFYTVLMINLYSHSGNNCSALGKEANCDAQSSFQNFA